MPNQENKTEGVKCHLGNTHHDYCPCRSELQEELSKAKEEILEQARLLGMSGSRTTRTHGIQGHRRKRMTWMGIDRFDGAAWTVTCYRGLIA